MALEYRFYNGYNAINEAIPYSKQGDGKLENLNGLWHLKADAKSIFEAPGMIELDGRGATVTNFDRTICAKYSTLGVVLIDAKRNEMQFGYPVEKTDKDGKRRGDEIHHEYMMDVVQKYISNVEEHRAAGRTPFPAQGYVKYALRHLGIEDPALQVKNFVQRAAETDRVAALEALVEKLMAQNTKVATGADAR